MPSTSRLRCPDPLGGRWKGAHARWRVWTSHVPNCRTRGSWGGHRVRGPPFHLVGSRQGESRRGRRRARLVGLLRRRRDLTFVSEDLDRARGEVRPVTALIGNHVAEVLQNIGQKSLPPEMEALIADRRGYDYHHHVRRDT